MKAFPEELVYSKEESIKGIKEPVPMTLVTPKNQSDTLILFLCGLNGKGLLVKYFNIIDAMSDYYIMSFDARAQGDNKNKSSRKYKTYINDLDCIVKHIKETMPQIKKIYLVGESWGTALALLYLKEHTYEVNGVFGWNMPSKPVDITPLKGKAKLKMICQTVWTFLTNIDTYQEAPLAPCLTNNKMLVRISNMTVNKKLSSRVTLASWRSFKPAWKYLLKTNDNNYLYIQSKEDAMLVDSILSKLVKCEHSIIFENGFHILSFDLDNNKKLFNLLNDFIKK